MSDVQSNRSTDSIAERKQRKMKFSYNDADISTIWDAVSEFIENNMLKLKGVNIPNFGQFCFNQVKLDIGHSKYVMLQRPLFVLSEKICQNLGLKQNKVQITGSVPIVPLNYSSIMMQSQAFTRDQIETCVRELIQATNQSIGYGQSASGTELVFTGIGRLQIKDQQVKFKFYKSFINALDQSGKVITTMQNRPNTADSVMSDRNNTSRIFTSILPLPKISTDKLPSIHEQEIFQSQQPDGECDVLKLEDNTILNETVDPNFPEETQELNLAEEYPTLNVGDETIATHNLHGYDDFGTDSLDVAATDSVSNHENQYNQLVIEPEDSPKSKSDQDDYLNIPLVLPTPKPPSRSSLVENCESKRMRSSGSNQSVKCHSRQPTERPSSSISSSVCCADNNQDLCYVCYQRERRNVPISFKDQLQERESEEERVLQSFQNMKDKEHLMLEQEKLLTRKHDSQKAAAYNLGVSEAVRNQQKAKDPNAYRSFLFEHRPLTPPKVYKQTLLNNELSKQVEDKNSKRKKTEEDESFIERLEQMQLAEDLAKQRENYLNNREKQKELYKRALDAQVATKPSTLPKLESDSTEPFFGKNDVTQEKILEKRRKAQEILKSQMEDAEQKKRDALLKRLQEQNHEEKVLDKVKHDLVEDRAKRYERSMKNRIELENEWLYAKQEKQERDLVDRLKISMADELLLHEQCDKYHRCAQCKRKMHNKGSTNIWKETYFIPGTRYIY